MDHPGPIDSKLLTQAAQAKIRFPDLYSDIGNMNLHCAAKMQLLAREQYSGEMPNLFIDA
jgi:hypothetical protein